MKCHCRCYCKKKFKKDNNNIKIKKGVAYTEYVLEFLQV